MGASERRWRRECPCVLAEIRDVIQEQKCICRVSLPYSQGACKGTALLCVEAVQN